MDNKITNVTMIDTQDLSNTVVHTTVQRRLGTIVNTPSIYLQIAVCYKVSNEQNTPVREV